MKDAPLTKMHYLTLMIIPFVPLAITLIALVFLPETVPVHFNGSGVADRFGSKYEMLLLPVIAVVFGLIMTRVTKFSESKDDYAGRLTFCVSLGAAVLFIAITAVILYAVFEYTA